MKRRNHLSPYRIMWLFVMFDLPTTTKKEKKSALEFRNDLLDMGFEMSQFSVYLKYCVSSDKSEAIKLKITRKIPYNGKIDILTITDKQFANMSRFYSGKHKKNDKNPTQLHLF